MLTFKRPSLFTARGGWDLDKKEECSFEVTVLTFKCPFLFTARGGWDLDKKSRFILDVGLD